MHGEIGGEGKNPQPILHPEIMTTKVEAEMNLKTEIIKMIGTVEADHKMTAAIGHHLHIETEIIKMIGTVKADHEMITVIGHHLHAKTETIKMIGTVEASHEMITVIEHHLHKNICIGLIAREVRISHPTINQNCPAKSNIIL